MRVQHHNSATNNDVQPASFDQLPTDHQPTETNQACLSAPRFAATSSPRFPEQQLNRSGASWSSDNQKNADHAGSEDNPHKERSVVSGSESETCETRSFLLWIDGVGVWQILMGSHFLIGAPSSKPPEADLAIQANVRKQHAAIRVEREDWILDPLAETYVGNQRISKKASLQSGDQIRLGESVKLGFRIPSPLSNSAVLDFESSHRPLQSVDGVILLTDHCIVGPRRDQHIFCGSWQHSFVLFRRDSKLLCRSSGDFQMNGNDIEDVCEVDSDSTMESEHCRFRVEVIK